MFSLFELVSLFLMMVTGTSQQQPSTSQQQIQKQISFACLDVPRQSSSLFPEWGIGSEAIEIPQPISTKIPKNSETALLPNLDHYLNIWLDVKPSHSREDPWRDHLEAIRRLLYYLNSFGNEETSLFNPGELLDNNRILNEKCLTKRLDLQILAELIFHYNLEAINFLPLTCNGCCINKPRRPFYTSNICESNCLLVSDSSCFKSARQDFWKEVEDKLRIITIMLEDPFPLFFYSKTKCCQAIHQVVALVIVKSLDKEDVQKNTFKFYYFDSSGEEKLPISKLRLAIIKVFGDYPIEVIPCQQQPVGVGMLDDLSGILTLANVKLFIDSYLVISENIVTEKANKLIDSFNYFNLQRDLKTILVKKSIESLQTKLWYNLYFLGIFIARARESAIANYKTRGGSIETREFVSLKESLIREEKRFQDIFEVVNHGLRGFKEILDALSFCQELKHSLSFFNFGCSNVFSILSRKIFILENFSVKYERQNFSIVEKFLISDSARSTKFSLQFRFLKKIIEHWQKPASYSLFSPMFSSSAVLISTEEIAFANLLCGFLLEENLKFVGLTCCCSTGNKDWCFEKHCCNRRSSDFNNPLVIGSKDCFTDSLGFALSSDASSGRVIAGYLSDYRDKKDTYRNKPLVILIRCVTTCCRAPHQACSLVIYLDNLGIYQVWYYNPSNKKTNVLPFLENILKEVLGNNFTLSQFVRPLQTDNDIDLSGALSICGAKVIVDYLTQEEEIVDKLNKREELYPSNYSITPEIQTHLKLEIVITVFQRVFDHFIDGIKLYLAKATLSLEKKENVIMSNYKELLAEIVPLYNKLSIVSSEIRKGNRTNIKDFTVLVEGIYGGLSSASKW